MCAHDITETAARPQDANGHRPVAVSWCRRPSGGPDYAGLSTLLDEVFDLWERVEAEGTTEVIDDRFEALTSRIMGLRDFTGWDGVPGKLLR